MGFKSVFIGASMELADRQETATKFNRRVKNEPGADDIMAICSTYTIMGTGVNLPGASHSVFLDIEWTMRQEIQALGRTCRTMAVQTEPTCFGYFLLLRETRLDLALRARQTSRLELASSYLMPPSVEG